MKEFVLLDYQLGNANAGVFTGMLDFANVVM